eukprot:CAMPEP_0119515524 /NCGR_PEP_ID=MMETSP1344-20130328/32993_1 /TAXON_ID=236787 /ORGANISM="Florenciella parvula, Strain CCMP2471" /LENGTH=85 /DNA_ID=CAMNT_0007552939 /DNA_START=11 /DNA_END=265 /DNA_ORIENTATION=-
MPSYPGQKSTYNAKPSPHGGFKAAQRTNARTVSDQVSYRAPIPGLQRFGGVWGFCLKCLYENEGKTTGKYSHNRVGDTDPSRSEY